jgi:hypothetical protein
MEEHGYKSGKKACPETCRIALVSLSGRPDRRHGSYRKLLTAIAMISVTVATPSFSSRPHDQLGLSL